MKGRGAYPKDRKRLNGNELKVLQLLISNSNEPTLPSEIEELLDWDPRKTSNATSMLHGMDLIKASDYKVTLTEEEWGIKATGKAPFYWIGKEGQPIYKRAVYALEHFGSLASIFQRELDFELSLYPFRMLRKVTVMAQILNFNQATIVLEVSGAGLTSEELAEVTILSKQNPVKVTFESA